MVQGCIQISGSFNNAFSGAFAVGHLVCGPYEVISQSMAPQSTKDVWLSNGNQSTAPQPIKDVWINSKYTGQIAVEETI